MLKKGGSQMPLTLNQMLKENMGYENPECQAEVEAMEQELHTIKSTFKDWLRDVNIPTQMSEESTRQLLITLVDEP
jgi:hypothetical protein